MKFEKQRIIRDILCVSKIILLNFEFETGVCEIEMKSKKFFSSTSKEYSW